MIDRILGLVPTWLWAALVVACALGACAERTMLQNERVAHNITKTTLADFRASVQKADKERTQLALEETERRRELEVIRNKAATENMNAILAETARTAAARAVAAERGRVFDGALDTARPGSGQGHGDPAVALLIDQATAPFRELLKTCRREGREDAGELEDLATQVRGLIGAYRVLDHPPQPTP